VADPVYGWLSHNLLAFGRPLFLLAGLSAALFIALFALELLAPRFWCAHLCPLGALLGIAAKVGLAKRARAEECGKCSLCVSNCPTQAVQASEAEELLCIQCNSCASDCPQGAMSLTATAAPSPIPTTKTRRVLLGSITAGVALAAFGGASASEKKRDWTFLRPPGGVEEDEFNRRCIRCGACMRVCPRTALHPTFAEAGLGGIWTPRLVPRLGYCEYHCRLCGQVCPTGAIKELGEGAKEKWIIGIAVIDRNHCLPYRSATGCIVCEEHCPTSPKAILFEEREGTDAEGRTHLLKYPKVVEERCIGCGICENRCPLEGRSAIVVGREAPRTGATTDTGGLGY
jgi:MauM/NapG family ferredoxin protein